MPKAITYEEINGENWKVTTITNASGAVTHTAKELTVDPSNETQLYYHMTISGGDNMEPPGIQNNGSDEVNVDVTVRVGPSDTDDIATTFAGPFRVLMRDSDGGVYDIIKIVFSAGTCNFDYSTTGDAAIVSLKASDLDNTAGPVKLVANIVGDNEFKVFRNV